MKKRTKIISLILALMLVAAIVPVTLVQASSTDDYLLEDYSPATEDEAESVPNITSIEITKAPDNTMFEKNYFDGQSYIRSDELFEGLEMLISFDDGTTYNYSYDEDYEVPQCFYENGIAEKYEYDEIALTIKEVDEYGDINNPPLGDMEISYELLGCTATQKITVLENDHITNPITKIEITKAPDKVFTTPLLLPVNGSEDELVNSVSYNMQGAELTVYRENGDKYTYTFEEPRGCDYVPPEYGGTFYTEYNNMFMSDNDYNQIKVIDSGNYKASVTLVDKIVEKEFTTEFTANHSGANPEDNPATPGEVITPSESGNTVPTSSQNGSSSTSDMPSNNNSSASNTNNGAVATGNTAVSVTLLSVLMIAAGILAVVSRKKQLF